MKKEIIFGILLITLTIAGVSFIINYSDHDHDHEHDELHYHSVEIEGKNLKFLTIREIANLWKIDSEVLLSKIIMEFRLEKSYTIDTILGDIREEYAFSPALIKDISEEIKQQGAQK